MNSGIMANLIKKGEIMALYCYIVETGYYEDRTANILGHTEKYSHEEFDNICIEITKKYGDVEEVEYFSSYDKSNVEEIKYKIEAHELIKHLVNEYGFIELNIPVNDGYNSREISRKPVPPENLRMVRVKPTHCPWQEGKSPKDADMSLFEDKSITCTHADDDFDIVHPLARCYVNLIKERKNDNTQS